MEGAFMFVRIFICSLWLSAALMAQTVQPVIVEYKGKADGKFEITNNTQMPMVVVLEPKSFSITPEGRGIFRPLDSSVHVELSTMSVKLQPKQTYYVFYKASSDRLPAWFTLYATFSSAQHSPGLDVRIMLPHTVYLYQKEALSQTDVDIKSAVYSARTKKVTLTLSNSGTSLARVQDVVAKGGKDSLDVAGFPFLPGAERHLEMDWTGENPQTELSLRFEHFSVKHVVNAAED